jgi:hypothetical protein
MLLASIIVFLAFLLLPLFIQAAIILVKIITEGAKGSDSLLNPSPTLFKLKSHACIFYAIITAYAILTISSIFWMLFEITNGLHNSRIVVFSATWVFLSFGGIITRVIYRTNKIKEKYPPPDTAEGYSKWQNIYFDRYFEGFGRELIITLSILVFTSLVFVVIMIYLQIVGVL